MLPKSHADDLFIYYSCRRIGLEATCAKDACVYFSAPNSIGDFVDQYSRFKFWIGKAREEFGTQLVETDLEVPGMGSYLLSTLVQYPYGGIMWAGCQLTSWVAYFISYQKNFLEQGLYKTWVLGSPGNIYKNLGLGPMNASFGDELKAAPQYPPLNASEISIENHVTTSVELK